MRKIYVNINANLRFIYDTYGLYMTINDLYMILYNLDMTNRNIYIAFYDLYTGMIL